MRGLVTIAMVMFGFFMLLGSSAFVVSETEQVVTTQFGKPVGEPIKDAGLHFKIPFIQEANFFPKTFWNGMVNQVKCLPWTRPTSG